MSETIEEIIDKKAKSVEANLKDIMATLKPVISDTLFQAMNYSVFSGGKRLRPILAMMSAEMVGGNVEKACKIGSALELIHTYSLIHDDLPSMDDDDYRRGKKANHRVYGPGIAVLAGDGLLTSAFGIISGMDLKAEKIVKIIQVISRGAGVNGMVGGQVLDLKSEGKEIELDQLKKIHLAKTAGLFRAAVLSGAYTANPDKEELEALNLYAEKLGLLFQITDDILDITGDEAKLGKKVGSDSQLDKSTYPKLMGLDKAKIKAARTAEEAKDALGIFEEGAVYLKQLIDLILKRDH